MIQQFDIIPGGWQKCESKPYNLRKTNKLNKKCNKYIFLFSLEHFTNNPKTKSLLLQPVPASPNLEKNLYCLTLV